MGIIKIEQDNPKTVMRIRDRISAVSDAPSDLLVSYYHALALGWIMALGLENVISPSMRNTLETELKQTHQARQTQVQPIRPSI
ncbi:MULTISPECIES: hypothetical protein [unclassified Pseudomonas]|jgi:hypothetical protein|uniref:hypothetical protein n=1 Tax=unclassified Pseudomonas TaxID=196821 RepID=UPI001785589E|nr:MULTISPECIES: hypothetical protein [unclassified Pseudomonas]MBD8710113.1 hypothetical protein [Pseudomonas sp. CFBP 13711]MBD8715401.1 hypothetical protein [Pseudomonas sp. CFBP 13715]